MRKTLLKIIAILAVAAAAAGCAGYNKLLKSKDYDKMYTAALGFYEKGKFERAKQLFEEVAIYYKNTVREDTIMYYWGSAFYKSGEFESSAMIFDSFRRQFGRSPFIEDVEYMYTMGFYFSSPEPNRDQTVTVQAISAIHEYLERYPESIRRQLCLARVDELQKKLYDKAFINARTYYKTGRYKSAVIALRNALSQYPASPHREEILYLTARSSYELAFNSIPSLQRDRYLDMMDAYYTFVAEFPDSKHRREADRMQKVAREYLDRHGSDAAEPEEKYAPSTDIY